jgi:hypothetical protein
MCETGVPCFLTYLAVFKIACNGVERTRLRPEGNKLFNYYLTNPVPVYKGLICCYDESVQTRFLTGNIVIPGPFTLNAGGMNDAWNIK